MKEKSPIIAGCIYSLCTYILFMSFYKKGITGYQSFFLSGLISSPLLFIEYLIIRKKVDITCFDFGLYALSSSFAFEALIIVYVFFQSGGIWAFIDTFPTLSDFTASMAIGFGIFFLFQCMIKKFILKESA